jgi:diguanylate cyclase (GGDEF)-like protein
MRSQSRRAAQNPDRRRALDQPSLLPVMIGRGGELDKSKSAATDGWRWQMVELVALIQILSTFMPVSVALDYDQCAAQISSVRNGQTGREDSMGLALGGKLSNYLNMFGLVSAIVTMIVIYFFVGAQNRNAAEVELSMMESGVAAFASEREVLVEDYGVWEAARTAYEARDLAWLHANIFDSSHLGSTIDVILMSDARGENPMAWAPGTANSISPDLIGPQQVQQLRTAMRHIGEEERSAMRLLTIDDRPFMALVSYLGGHSELASIDVEARPIMMMGSFLEPTTFAHLEEQYSISHLEFVPTVPDQGNRYILRDPVSGEAFGALVWRSQAPGTGLLRAAFIPLVAYILVFLTISGFASKRVRAMANQVEQSAAQALQATRLDRLTSLPNRHGFLDALNTVTDQQKGQPEPVAVIFIDLNGFKEVNDTAGHARGDLMLQTVAERIRTLMPADAILARMGGDEFAVALVGEDLAQFAFDRSAALCTLLCEDVELDGEFYTVGAAMGIAHGSLAEPEDIDCIMHQADIAMYRAKAEKLMHPLVYDEAMEAEEVFRRALAREMEAGLPRGEFSVVYQPIVSASTGEIAAVEALTRWVSPTRGTVSPDIFIPVAEQSGLIHELGAFVLRTACLDFADQDTLSIAVNLSPVQLSSPSLPETYRSIANQSGVPTNRVELEITEGYLINDLERGRGQLDRLVDLGFQINLDDFGTGFASLGYLRELPFNKIKIDKSYIDPAGRSPEASEMLQGLSLIGQSLKLKMVAEGVETQDQKRLLRLLGFDYLQGWLFSGAITADQIRRMLKDESRREANG